METYPILIVNSDPHYKTKLIGYTILYNDNVRRGYWEDLSSCRKAFNAIVDNDDVNHPNA